MSATKRVLVVGAGGRVTDAVLPVLARATALYELAGVFARKERAIDAHGVAHRVRPFVSLREAEVAAVDIVYVVVAKPAVGAVLASLARFDVSRIDLLLETPVVLFRNLHHARRVAPFHSAHVAEDISALPWLEVVRRATSSDGSLGAPEHLTLDRAGYAYHGVALAKALLGAHGVVSGRRRRAGGVETRALRMQGGGSVDWTSPRDYATGSFTLRCARGVLTDRLDAAGPVLRPMLTGERCVGVEFDGLERGFDDDEVALAFGRDPRASITARMQDMKRIGLLALFRRLHAGLGAYPLQQGLDDMLVDYHLEKLGAYVSNPLTSAGGALRRVLEAGLGVVGRARGG